VLWCSGVNIYNISLKEPSIKKISLAPVEAKPSPSLKKSVAIQTVSSNQTVVPIQGTTIVPAVVGQSESKSMAIYEEANRCEMFYVHNRWLGGMLTNFQTIKQGIDRLN
jgi:hypothetical protein